MDWEHQKVKREYYFLHCFWINHPLPLSMCVHPSLATLFSISLFNQLIFSFSHFSLDFVDQPSTLFHSPSSEPAQQNSNSGHFNHLPSPLLPSWCKIPETKGSEQNFLNAGCTLEWLTELFKTTLPSVLRQCWTLSPRKNDQFNHTPSLRAKGKDLEYSEMRPTSLGPLSDSLVL